MKPDAAEGIAIAVLSAIADDSDRLGRFIELSGLRPERLRAAASEPGFLGGVLDYVMTDEALLLACAQAIGEPPVRISQAHAVLRPEPLVE